VSIWCSREAIGYDDIFEDGATNHGEVVAYANGWSNHYPTTDGTAETPACISLATIPPWCVPGHRDEYAEHVVGPWLRLDLFGDEAKSAATPQTDPRLGRHGRGSSPHPSTATSSKP
jgi:hypothetical protein